MIAFITEKDYGPTTPLHSCAIHSLDLIHLLDLSRDTEPIVSLGVLSTIESKYGDLHGAQLHELAFTKDEMECGERAPTLNPCAVK
jgi:hypothetical protein